MRLFAQDGDYQAFERVLTEACERVEMRLLAYCVMPNHWHLVVWPHADGDLSSFLGWLTMTHTQRWHASHRTIGSGHLYQGRFKSFPVQTDEHFLTVCRYVERNALRANLVPRAEDWRWSSLWRRTRGEDKGRAFLSEWPAPCPRQWLKWVNEPQTQEEVDALRRCVTRGQPFGSETWVQSAARRLGLESTFRSRGRPKKQGSDNHQGS
jgi:putative transposase